MDNIKRPTILQDNSIWMYPQLVDMFCNASFNPNEFCMKRIEMPDGFVDETKIIG